MADKNKSGSQIQNFRDAARSLGSDNSEEAFDRTLKKVASARPAPMHKPAKKREKETAKR